MTWEEKLAACKSLGDCALRMRKPGDWYVSWNVETVEQGHPGMLAGRYGNGASPQLAVEDHWAKITASDVVALVTDATRSTRREVRWNGFMWWDVVSSEQPA